MPNTTENSKPINIASFNKELEFDDNRIKTKVIIETLFSKEIRILLKEGQIMKEHKTPFPIIIHVLEGKIELGVNGTAHLLKSGAIIALEGNVPHDLNAKENSIIRLTLSMQDKVEHVNDVIEAKN
ncbi:cupin domain-containing protein [Flavobacterium polysaccharolyticum]|uniref:Cupin domain-containing protein n=1 Tax=Flavobacterium polysaccharolyticum TaxID=3133148 RepID=A0ABU9NP00_9FLAO